MKVACLITILANIAIYVYYFKDAKDAYVYYVRNSKISQLQPLFIATKSILIAVGIALYHSVGFSALYVLLAIQGVYVVFVIILRPFKRVIDVIRSIVL